jgi:hypothetical protein
MLISKSYLKQIIKEETQKILNKETVIQMSPSDYLNLTTHEVHYPLTDIIKRYEFRVKKIAERLKEEGIDSDKAISMAKQELANGLEQAKMPALAINKDGKVIDHEGRLRSYYYGFIKQPKKEKIPVTLIHPTNLDVLSPHLILKNQFDDEKSITLNKSDTTSDTTEIPDFSGIYTSRTVLNDKIKNIYNSLIKYSSKEEVVNNFNEELQKYTVYELVNDKRKEERPLSIKMENIYNIKIYNPNAQFYSVFPTDKKIELVKQ